MFLVVLGLLVLSTTVEAKREATHSGVPPSDFVLAVEGDHISLKAEEASLEVILTAMGKQMDIEVIGEIPKREPITTQFEGLSLPETMHHLGLNYGFQLDSSGEKSNTKKLFILPRRTQTALSQPQTNAVEPSQELVTQITQARGDSEPLKQKQKEPRKAS